MDIVIYTNPEVLEHKKSREFPLYYWKYWKFSRMPKHIELHKDRIYFAVKGFVVGSFEIADIIGNEIEWSPTSWKELNKPIPCKPFRGFRYKWW